MTFDRSAIGNLSLVLQWGKAMKWAALYGQTSNLTGFSAFVGIDGVRRHRRFDGIFVALLGLPPKLCLPARGLELEFELVLLRASIDTDLSWVLI